MTDNELLPWPELPTFRQIMESQPKYARVGGDTACIECGCVVIELETHDAFHGRLETALIRAAFGLGTEQSDDRSAQ